MNPKKIYLSRFRRAIPFAFPNKRGLTRQVNQMLDDYLEFVPDATLDQMMADLGKPEDTAQSYLQDNEQDIIDVYYNWPAFIIEEPAIEITETTDNLN